MILIIGGKKYVEKGRRERAGRFKLSLAEAGIQIRNFFNFLFFFFLGRLPALFRDPIGLNASGVWHDYVLYIFSFSSKRMFSFHSVHPDCWYICKWLRVDFAPTVLAIYTGREPR